MGGFPFVPIAYELHRKVKTTYINTMNDWEKY